MEPGVQPADAFAVLEYRALGFRQGLEVAAGAKDALGSGDDDSAHRVVVPGFDDGVGEPLTDLEVEGVAPFRPVDADQQRRAVALAQNEVSHVSLLAFDEG